MELFERRRPLRVQPFAGSELLREVLDEGDWSGMRPSAPPSTPEEHRLDALERFLVHAVGFVIGALNLFLANWAHPSRGWWFWIPIAAWSVILAVHGAWALAVGRRSS